MKVFSRPVFCDGCHESTRVMCYTLEDHGLKNKKSKIHLFCTPECLLKWAARAYAKSGQGDRT